MTTPLDVGYGSDERTITDSTPGNLYSGDYTIGLRFTANVPGRITHIRAFLGAGTHTFSVWDAATQTKIMTSVVETFSGAADHRQVALPTPVKVVAGHEYVATASVNSVTYGYTTPIPTSLTSNITLASDMMYGVGADVFPTNTGSGYHNHVDVVFQKSGLGLWLDASALTGLSNGDNVTTWSDSSPAARHATAVDGNKPLYRPAGLNSLPAVDFSGASRRLSIPGLGTALTGKTQYTAFYVAKVATFGYSVIATAPTDTIWRWLFEYEPSGGFYWGHSNGNFFQYTTCMTANVPHVLTLHHTAGSGSHFYVNGTENTSYYTNGAGLGSTVDNVNGDVYLGAYYEGSYPVDGVIAELIWYDHALTTTELQQVEDYLNDKYFGTAPTPVTVNLSGTGQLSAEQFAKYESILNLAGTGQLIAPIAPKLPITTNLVGSGQLSATVVPVAAASTVDMTLFGNGLFSAVNIARYLKAFAASGNGQLSTVIAPKQAINANLYSTGQLSFGVIRAGLPDDDGGWHSYQIGKPQPKIGPSWTTSKGTQQYAIKSGWFALLEKHAALIGNGNLASVIAPIRTNAAALAGSGQLSSDLLIRNNRTAEFSGLGLPTALMFQTVSRTIDFLSSGKFESLGAPNDGLSAIMTGGFAANFSGGSGLVGGIVGSERVYPDGLSADIVSKYFIPSLFAGSGDLIIYFAYTQQVIANLIGSGELTGGIKQLYPLLVQLAGSGQLTETYMQIFNYTVNLLGSGQLSAIDFAKYLSSLGLQGAGALTSLLMQIYPEIAPTGGVGTVTALISQRYTLFANFNGNGTLEKIDTATYGPDQELFLDTIPANLGAGDFTLGVKFTATAAGRITHLCAYVEGGTHYFSLWNASTGEKLVSVTNTSVGSRDWREVVLSTPFEVVVGASYIVTFSTNGLGYGYDTSTPASSADGLTVVQACASFNSDVFPYGPDNISGIGDAHFFADVTFQKYIGSGGGGGVTVLPDFASEGFLDSTVFEIYQVLANVSGSGSLEAKALHRVLVNLFASGALSGQAWSNYLVSLGLSGSGTLALDTTAFARYQRAAGFLGSGQLSSTQFQKFLLSMGVAGSGALTSLLIASYSVGQPASGAGTVSATISQKYTVPVGFSGGGTLAATAADIQTLDGLSATVVKVEGPPPFAPTSLTGLTVWLDASQLTQADGVSVGSAWNDLSGNGNHGAVVGSPAPVVKTNILNGKRVVRFTTNEGRIRGDGMISPTGMSNSSFTLIFVGHTVAGGSSGRIFSGVYPDEGNFLVGTHAAGRNCCFDNGWVNSGVPWTEPYDQWTTWGYVYTGNPNLGTFFVDGVESGTGAGGGAHGSHWNISGFEEAGHGAETCDVEVAELITYSRALTTTEREQVEDYLATKWGL